MSAPASVRIDKWLWAIRLYKTRTLATDACRQGRVTVDGRPVKPAHEVKVNELIQTRTSEITRTVKVLSLLQQRVGAAIVREYAEDLTPASEYQKPREPYLKPLFIRPKGAGRPTKKDRRQMDKFF